ncbi:MAG: hypothetical protein DRP68_04880 [Candidatus Omnitrophota bacterium]|nr:MAG: hypothetical protein DRP68_04880 [Candidatus Omnitrophota bacterium]RKY38464.1 MAG: hypothetical protein DRP72_01720 [Candidatus Omnitrophota bacterium]
MKRGIIICGILLFIPLFSFSFNLRIDTPKIKLKVKGGETITGSIKVENPSSEKIEVKIYLEDFLYTSPYDGAKQFFAPGTTEFSCSSWINFSPQEIVLPPFGKRRVNYSIKIPSEIEGGRYAVLFFETSLGEIEEEREGANIVILGRIGTLFFLEAKDSIKRADLENLKVEEGTIKGDFVNRSNVVIVSRGNFYIMDERGMVLDRGKIQDIYTFPNDKVPISIKPSKDLPSGRYTLISTFDLEEGDVLVKEIDFLKDSLGDIRILQVRD